MKILCVTWLDPPTTDYPLFLADAWKTLGHDVLLFAHDLDFSTRFQTRFFHAVGLYPSELQSKSFFLKLLETCDTFRPDVMLFLGSFVRPQTIPILRKKYKCIVGHFIGYNDLFLGDHAQAISQYDFLFVHDTYLIPILRGREYGKNPYVFYLPYMADPHEHRPLQNSFESTDYSCDIAFIGGISDNRAAVMRKLTTYNLKIWGDSRWLKFPDLARFYQSEPVYGLKKTKIYNSAKIVLNIEHAEKQINAISARVPEALACGGFVMTDWRQDLCLSELVENESIVSFRTEAELTEKVSYFLNHPAERQRISEAGRAIVLKSLTYDHGARKMLEEIELVRKEKL